MGSWETSLNLVAQKSEKQYLVQRGNSPESQLDTTIEQESGKTFTLCPIILDCRWKLMRPMSLVM